MTAKKNNDDYDDFEHWYFKILNDNPKLEMCKKEVYNALQIQGIYAPFTKQDVIMVRWAFETYWRRLQGL